MYVCISRIIGYFSISHFYFKIILLKKQKMVNVAEVSGGWREGFRDRLGKRFTVGTVKGWAGHGEKLSLFELDVDLPMGFMQRSVTIQTMFTKDHWLI